MTALLNRDGDEITPRFTEATRGQTGTFKVKAQWNELVEIELLITNGAAEHQMIIGVYEADVLIKVLQTAIREATASEWKQRHEALISAGD